MKKRLALFLALTLAFTSVDSVALVAGAAEEVQIIDESSGQDSVVDELEADAEPTISQMEVESVDLPIETEAAMEEESAAPEIVVEVPAEESSTEMMTEVPMTEMVTESPITEEMQEELTTEAQTEVSVTEEPEEEIFLEEVPETLSESETEIEGVFEDIFASQSGDSLVIEDIDIVAGAGAVQVEKTELISMKDTYIEKWESEPYAKFSLTFSNGDIQEIIFGYGAVYDQYGNEHSYRFLDADGQEVYELTAGSYSCVFSCNGEDYHTEAITVISRDAVSFQELKEGSNHVISGEAGADRRYYKFTPAQTGKYHFAPYNYLMIYDEENNFFDFYSPEFVFEKGSTYYIALYGEVWDSDTGNAMYEYDMRISIIPEVVSATRLSTKTKYVYPFESLTADFEVRYTNDKTATVSFGGISSTIKDEMGVVYQYEVYDAAEKQIESWEELKPGDYTQVIKTGDKELYRGPITILGLDQLPEVKEGTQTVKVSGSSNGAEYYRFTPEEDGTYRIECAETGCNIRDAEGGYVHSNYLKGGTEYYLELYQWNAEASAEKSLTISNVPTLTGAQVISGKTVFLSGVDPVYNHDTKLELTYSDGTTDTIQLYGDVGTDKYGSSINCMVTAKVDDRSYGVYEYIPAGEYDLVFVHGETELCRQPIKVASVKDIVSGSLEEGSNSVESGVTDWKVYSFIPETTGAYEFAPHAEMNIYRDENGLLVQIFDVDGHGYELEQNKTYYVLLRGSIMDGWDEVYSWSMKVTSAPVVETIEISPAVTEFTLMADGNGIDRILDSDKYTLKITYMDQSVEEIPLKDAFEEMTDAAGVYVSEYTTTPGNYNLHFVYAGEELTVPVELKAIPEFSRGTWDLLNPLSVENSEGFAVYQITGGVETVSYTLESDIIVDGALYAEDGSRVKRVYDKYEWKIKLPAGVTYYLLLDAADRVKQYTVTASAQKQPEITELCAVTRKGTYLAGFDILTSEDVAAKMIYDDGTSRMVYGNSRAVSYDIKSSSNPEQVYGLYDILPAGSYFVVPRVTSGSAVNMKTEGASVEAVPLNPASLEEVFEDIPVALKNLNDKMYRFVPKEDGNYEATGDESLVYAYSYDTSTNRWSEMTAPWRMKAGETYVIAAYEPFTVKKYSGSAPLPGEDETSKGGGLTLDQMERVVIAASDDTVKYTFTPTISGKYALESFPAENEGEDTYVELYQGNNELGYNDDGGNDANFRLVYYLEAGIEYTYEVGLYDESGKFDICLTSADKPIKKLEIDEIGEDSDGFLDVYSSYMLVTYADGTTRRLPISTEQDDCGNEFTYMSKLIKEEEKQRTYRIGVRYRVNGTEEWTTVEREAIILTMKGRILGDAEPGVPVVRKFSAFEDEGHDYYTLRVAESGEYGVVTISEGNVDAYVSIIDEDGNYSVNLEAEKTYYVRVSYEMYSEGEDPLGSYSVTVHRQKELSGLEIEGEPNAGYRRLSENDPAFYRSIKIKVNFEDGSSEYVYGNEPILSDGREVDITRKEISDTKLRLMAELDGRRATKYVSLKDPATAPLMQESANGYTLSFKDTAYGNVCVMRVVPKQTGTYTLKFTMDGAEEGAYAYGNVYNSNLFREYTVDSFSFAGIKLEAGKEYYIAAAPGYSSEMEGSTDFHVSLLIDSSSHVCEWRESAVLKQPTCEEEGLREEKCSICGSVRETTIPALGHQHTEDWQRVAATCTVDGYESQVCSRCGKLVVRAYVSALGHDFSGKWIVDTEASEGKEGSQHKECARGCGERIDEIIPARPIPEIVNKVEEINASIENIDIPQGGGSLDDEEILAVEEAVKALTDIGSENLLNNVPNIADTMETLEELAVAADDQLADTIVSRDEVSGVALSKITGASITAAVHAKDAELAEGEMLSARVQVATSAQAEAYEDLGMTTAAVDISLDLVKQNENGEITGTVAENVALKAPIQVTLQIPQSFADKEFALYHITAGGNVKINYKENEDGTIRFMTPSLSDFVFALIDCGEGSHSETKTTVTVEPTCSQPGRQEEICQACGKAVEVTVIQPIAHSLIDKIDKEATCGTAGSQHKECTVCGYKEAATAIPATGKHALTVKIDKQATCGAAGSQHKECTVCGYKEAATAIPATGKHTLAVKIDKQATCGTAGSQHKECTVCGYKEAATAIPATGKHTLAVKIDKQATCGAAGSQHKGCTVCGYKEAATVIPATNKHNFGAYTTTKEATAIAEGIQTRSCRVCGKTENKAIKKLPATIKVNTNTVLLKTKQKTSAFVISGLAKGDSVKSIVSSKKSVVTVSGVKAKGTCKLTAGKKAGSAVLTIRLASGLKKKVKVKVQTKAVQTKSIKNVNKKLVVKVKKKVKLAPILNPITSTDKITYSSSNKKVAIVSSKGVIKGIKKGTATITIKAGKKKFACRVTVKK